MEGIRVRAKLVELWTRLIEYDGRAGIYNNGQNNLYPNEMERVIMNSPTASRSAGMLAKFIAGAGLQGPDPIVNREKNFRLTDIIKQIAESLSIQAGAFIHVGYGFDPEADNFFRPNKLSVLDYVKCRISKEDDNSYPGAIIVNDFENSGRRISRVFSQTRKSNTEKWYYPFNPSQEVIRQQINAAQGRDISEKIQNYRGQVYYLNLTPKFKYAVSKFDPVYNDCDTEYRMSLYANSMTRGGFLGKTAVLTQGLDDEQSKQVESDVRNWLGAENSSHIYHLDVDHAEDLENVLKIIQVDSQYDDDMFNNTDKRLRRNISGAANNIPEPLIYAGEGALFGTSGETYRQMKQFYSEQTGEERRAVEDALGLLGFPVEIVPIGSEEPRRDPAPQTV